MRFVYYYYIVTNSRRTDIQTTARFTFVFNKIQYIYIYYTRPNRTSECAPKRIYYYYYYYYSNSPPSVIIIIVIIICAPKPYRYLPEYYARRTIKKKI